MREVFFVGIGGASGVGKSSLARVLGATYNSPVVEIMTSCGFKKEINIPTHYQVLGMSPTYNVKNCIGTISCWDPPDSMVEQSMLRQLERLQDVLTHHVAMPMEFLLASHGNVVKASWQGKEYPIGPLFVFVTGPTLFCHEEVAAFMDVAIWLDADQDTIGRRRWQRSQLRKPKKEREHLDKFLQKFADVDWRVYKKYEADQKKLCSAHDGVMIDASKAVKVVAEEAIA